VSQQPFQLDHEGFDKIHREYGDRLIQGLTGFVRDRDKAEDIAARAFETAWEKRGKFRGEFLASTWIEAIARNEARQSHNRERIRRFDSIDGAGVRELAAPEALTGDLEKRDDRLRLKNALAQLPVKYQRPLMAHFVERLSIREIAGRERVPLGTVLSRIHTGKQLLRQAWERPEAQTERTKPENSSYKPPEDHRSPAPQPGGCRPSESPDLAWDR
jgi:RNA polymerase sigma-70 factor (ECF subfamily)